MAHPSAQVNAAREDVLRELDELLSSPAAADGARLESGDRGADLPPSLLGVLKDAVAALREGHDVRVVSSIRELTTQEAADILNVSRPFLIKLLDRGDIPHSRTGTHRRISTDDLLAYRARRSAVRTAALSEMAQDALTRGTVAS